MAIVREAGVVTYGGSRTNSIIADGRETARRRGAGGQRLCVGANIVHHVTTHDDLIAYLMPVGHRRRRPSLEVKSRT